MRASAQQPGSKHAHARTRTHTHTHTQQAILYREKSSEVTAPKCTEVYTAPKCTEVGGIPENPLSKVSRFHLRLGG